jgi:hypothetical protein
MDYSDVKNSKRIFRVNLINFDKSYKKFLDNLWNIFDKMQIRNTNVSGFISTRSPPVIALFPIEWHVKKWFRCSKGKKYQ